MMKTPIFPLILAGGFLLGLHCAPQPASAQTAPAKAAPNAPAASGDKAAPKKQRGGAFDGLNSDSKEPIQIEAAKLDIFDKEQRAVYIGDVVAVKGKSTLRCTKLTIFYDNKNGNAEGGAKQQSSSQNSSVKKLICDGPVSLVSCTQKATGDHGEYESATGLAILTGNVVLADGPNVQNGDKLVYNTNDGTATVTGTKRVGGIFIPGSDATKDKKGKDGDPKAKPAADAKNKQNPGCT